MKKIFYTRVDGGLSVVHPSEGARLANWITLTDGTVVQGGARWPVPVDNILRSWPINGAVANWAETEEEFVTRIAAKDVPPGVAYQIVDKSGIPTDRTFRDAWKAGIGKVEHDIAKCKTIAHDKRRAMRAVELAPLDDIIAKQIPGNNFQQIEAQRQVIRDKYAAMQTAIDAAQDVAVIKAALGL